MNTLNLTFVFFVFAFCLLGDDEISIKLNLTHLDSKILIERKKAKQYLDQKDPSSIAKYIYTLLLELDNNKNDKIIINGINYLGNRDKKYLLKNIVIEGLLHQNYKIRAMTIKYLKYLPEEKKITPKIKNVLRACLNDRYAIVRVYAALILLDYIPNEIIMPILISELGNYKSGSINKSPYTISSIVKGKLSDNSKETKKYLKLFYKNTEDYIIRYQILDILAYVNGKIINPIYSYYAPPTEEEKKKLDKFKYLIYE